MRYLLAADIGATNSRFAVFRLSGDAALRDAPRLILCREHWFATADFSSFRTLLSALAALPGPFVPAGTALACLAPPGPVTDRVCRPPNIPWDVRAEEVTEIFGIRQVHLVNDFVAQGYACLLAFTDPDMRRQLGVADIYAGFPAAGSPVAVIGAGTGCGKALLLPDIGLVLPTEGGHGDFPFIGKAEAGFADFIRTRTGKSRVIGDMVLSGAGLTHLFAFHTGQEALPEEISPLFAPERRRESPALESVLAWFARLYARACRNFILDTLALGGLCVTGGMAVHAPVLSHPAFFAELHDGDIRGDLLGRLPVRHMRSRQAGLWGAAYCAVLRACM